MLTARRWLTTLLGTGVAGAVTLAPAAALPAAAAQAAEAPAAAAPMAAAPMAAAPMAAGMTAALGDPIGESQQWVLNMLHVPDAWRVTEGAGVTVAVLDSGVFPKSDLTGSVTDGPNLTGLNTPEQSQHWGEHGTWMASIIAGHGHDNGGIMGVAPEAKILSIRVIPDKDDPKYGQYQAEPEKIIQRSLAKGIMDAVRDGAKVISMSIGYSSPSAAVRGAVQYAYSRGVVLVASSGNSGHDDERRDRPAPVSFPADYPGVISVGAVDRYDHPAAFSSNNLSVQVAAPGVKVPAQGRDGLYWTVDGTSPACALVAGVVALIESQYPHLPPALVLKALTSTATRTTPAIYNTGTGFGTVNAARALSKAGQLTKSLAARSPVASSERFGGGPAAIPAAPVSPRGVGELVLYVMLAIVSLGLVAAASVWLAVVRNPPTGAHAAYTGAPGYGPPPHGQSAYTQPPYTPPPYAPPPHTQPPYAPPGYGPPDHQPGYQNGSGHHAPDNEHGAQGDAWQR